MCTHFSTKNPGRSRRFYLAAGLVLLALGLVLPAAAQAATVTVDVVAMDQVITYNRMAAFSPAGMIFALARDVFPKGTPAANQTLANSCAMVSCSPGDVQLRDDKRPRPLTLRVNERDTIEITLTNLLVNNANLTDAKNEAPGIELCEEAGPVPPNNRPGICQSEQPATRNVSIHVNGMKPVSIADDGSNVGGNASSLAAPGVANQKTYTLIAEKEGAYTITSGPNLGGQGGSGAIASGLFGILNVEPEDSTWFRNQLTRAEMELAIDTTKGTNGFTADGQPILDYGAVYPDAVSTTSPGPIVAGTDVVVTPASMDNIRIGSVLTVDSEVVRVKSVTATTFTADFGSDHSNVPYVIVADAHPYADKPILAILDGTEIFHNELNAVIVGPGPNGSFPNDLPPTRVYPNRGEPFREFTIAFHDEIKVVQAFPGWFNTLPFTLGSVKDGFAVNYGTGGIGAEIIGNRLGVGPMNECVECKYEEFFLTSWVVGDPAMIVDVPANAGLEALLPGQAPPPGTQGDKATKAFYPDDPSNTFHGYLNDRTKIRNIHVGTEHHIFHLHAHQWLFASLDDDSNYLDAQALGPGSSFTYEIAYGGGGNRNKTAGDSIFHCHFYPHFAQGMWGLWRVHDTFEIGSLLDADGRVLERGLPDAEICAEVSDGNGGTELQCGGYDGSTALAGGSPTPAVVPIPHKGMAPMPGAFVASVDDDDNPETPEVDVPFMGYPFYIPGTIGHRPPTPPMDLLADGGIPRHVINGGTSLDHNGPIDFNKELTTATGYQLPETGTPQEKAAMDFHGPQPGVYHTSYKPEGGPGFFEVNGLPPVAGAPYAEPCRSDANDGGGPGNLVGNPRNYRASVIELDVDFNKVGWHFGQQRIIVLDDDVQDTLNDIRAPEPFVMRANTGDCVDFDHTNLVPNVYQLDDFQVKTPTDVIGQHIHLVKFDVMSADGAANGWNYEDGTLSPDETAERIHALEASGDSWTGDSLGTAGPRTTRQRWYIDPGWKGNVFTHDHYGPSTHQQAGLYATLLIEPEGSKWTDPVTGTVFGDREDGGPTSWRADIDCANCTGADADLEGDAWREFYLEFADFQVAYRGEDDGGTLNVAGTPVNPSDRNEVGLPDILLPNCDNAAGVSGPNGCRPEAISAADPGTFVVNYRNEPIPLRVRKGPEDPKPNDQAAGQAGDLSYAFSSGQHDGAGGFVPLLRSDTRLNTIPEDWPYNTNTAIQTANQGALTGDPFTPLLRVYEDDKVYLRVQVGAHEEGHNFSINGIRWLQSWASGYSGFRNSQMAGISEQFIFRTPGPAAVKDGIPFEDYKYEAGSSVDARWNGSWGIMRAYNGLVPDLRPLPTNPDGKAPPVGGKGRKPPFIGVCPTDAPERKFDLLAVRAADVLPGGKLTYNPDTGLNDPTAMLYVKKSDLDSDGKLKADRRVEPLILRAAAGECIFITLTNQLTAAPLDLDGFNLMPMIVNEFNGNDVVPSSEVGLHAQLVEYDMFDSDGQNVGFNPTQSVGLGGTTTYKWYAGKVDVTPGTPGNRTATPVEYGAINLMASDPIEGSSKGLIGALIIEPADATWNDGSVTGRGRDRVTKPDGDVGTDGLLTRAAVTVDPDGNSNTNNSFRDFVVINQDDINMRFADGSPVPTVSVEEEPEDSGMKAINYRTDPIWQRLAIGPTANAAATRVKDFTDAFAGPDPVTPIFTASPGQEIRFRVLKPGGHNRNQVFTLHGHLWARHPFNNESTRIDPLNGKTFWHGEQMGHGPTNHANVVPLGGAGPAGDYLYRDMVPVHVYNGSWGILRVVSAQTQ